MTEAIRELSGTRPVDLSIGPELDAETFHLRLNWRSITHVLKWKLGNGRGGEDADVKNFKDKSARRSSLNARRPATGTSSSKVNRSPHHDDAAAEKGDDPVVAALGERVKRLRSRSELTLDELAAQSNVSRAMISKIERGEKSPTLAIIVRLARGLNVSLSELLGAEPETADVSVIKGEKRLSFIDPETGFQRQVLSPTHLDNGVEFLLHKIPPGKSSGVLSTYKNPTEKYLVVHEGTLVVYIDKMRYVLNTGDSFYFEIKAPYQFINEGDTPCSYYLVIVRKR